VAATHISLLAPRLNIGLGHRGESWRIMTAVYGDVSSAVTALTALAALAVAGAVVAFLLPKSAPAPPAKLLTPTSTLVGSQR
jgi:hypothetical protein